MIDQRLLMNLRKAAGCKDRWLYWERIIGDTRLIDTIATLSLAEQ